MSKKDYHSQNTINVETQTVSKNLRSELQNHLISEFTKYLNLDATLPNAVRKSLGALLSERNLTSEDVIALLAIEDSIEPEVHND